MNDSFLSIFNSGGLFSFFIKLFGIVLGLLYLFFSVIMFRQIEVMKRTVTVKDQDLLDSGAYLQIMLSALILFYALFIL